MTARALLVGLLLALSTLAAPAASAEDFLVIFDLSGSMGGAREIEPAKDALRDVMGQIQTPGAYWGLRTYGARCSGGSCLEIPLSREGQARIHDLLPALAGEGPSPMPAALRAARVGELAAAPAWRRQTSIVISDGLVDREEACREARLLRQDGVRVIVIGLELSGTPEGQETLRYVAEHPDCAAGTYVRANRPDLVGLLVESLALAYFGLPYRLIALALALGAGYHTARFCEFALERTSRLRREHIPPICRALFFVMALSSVGLFLSAGKPGAKAMVLSLIALGIAATYLSIALLGRARGRQPLQGGMP